MKYFVLQAGKVCHHAQDYLLSTPQQLRSLLVQVRGGVSLAVIAICTPSAACNYAQDCACAPLCVPWQKRPVMHTLQQASDASCRRDITYGQCTLLCPSALLACCMLYYTVLANK